MTRHLLLISLFVITLSSHSQTPVPGGNVSGIWFASGSPYLVQNSIMIPADSTLMIEAGVTVNFQGHYKLLVMGHLLALGTENDPIVFTAANSSTGWYGIRFDNTSSANDSSIIDHCTLQYGRATNPEPWGGAIEINNFSKVRVSYCLIEHNYAFLSGGGIDIQSCDPLIINNRFESNSTDFQANTLDGGGGLSCMGSNSIISGNTFINNSCISEVGGGGAIWYLDGSPLISNNTIINNSTTDIGWLGEGGGGGIFASGTGTLINNTISNNSATSTVSRGGGIYFYWHDYSTLIDNTFTNNDATNTDGCGGAIYCDIECNPTFTNNTIANNYAAQDGGAIYCNTTCNPVFRNCIIYGNKTLADSNQVYLYAEDCDPDFYYSDIQRGVAGFGLNGNFYTGTYQNNISKKPVFSWPSQGAGSGYNGVTANWAESGYSPCINAGDSTGSYPATDKNGNPRIVDNRIDMGAFEYQYQVGIKNTGFLQNPAVIPNPFTTSAVIYFKTNIPSASLWIYDSSGKIVQIIQNFSGDHIRIERGTLPEGIYQFEVISGNDRLGTGKFVVSDFHD
jgi:predicted outer membrane repeat protein